MTKKEVSINTTWDEFEIGTCRLFVEVLNQYIPVLFFQDHKPKPSISVKMLQSINDVLEMNKNEFYRLGKILGIETDLDLKNTIKEIHIDQDNDKYKGVYSEVIVHTSPNTQESVIVKDGRFMCVNDGTYFDTLEIVQEENEARGPTKEEREKIIATLLSS